MVVDITVIWGLQEATKSQSSKQFPSELIGDCSGTKWSPFTWKFNVFDRAFHMSTYGLQSQFPEI